MSTFPNPGMMGVDEAARSLVSPWGAAAVEGVGTGILVLMIFALVDRRNTSLTAKYLAPVFIGLTVALLISMLAPLTMGGWNPARDFGPRLVSFFAGWGETAIPGPSGGFWAYIVGPLLGGPLGAAVYEFLLRPSLPPEEGAGIASPLRGCVTDPLSLRERVRVTVYPYSYKNELSRCNSLMTGLMYLSHPPRRNRKSGHLLETISKVPSHQEGVRVEVKSSA